MEMGINKGECCTVLDNSKRVKWSVVSSGGQKGMVPGAIFAIPPPNQEAIDAAEKLKCQYERCIASLAEETNAHAPEHNIRHRHGCEELGPGAVHRDGR